ncbi:MAG: feruloyl-CoA synthase [Tardiphaga sp.]|jgi:feruloyl-CoA synthase|nr:feruloyl-CoA synthase [Tardiphaga sp.]
MKAAIQPIPLPWGDAIFQSAADGSLLVRNSARLGPYPERLGDRLQQWTTVAPDRVLLASRAGQDAGQDWRTVTYREALDAARAIGQALLDRGLSATRPVLILSGNGIEHGLLSLACLQVGIPFVPVSTAYSLISQDFTRLRDIAALVRPGLVFADDGARYAAALAACTPQDTEVVIARGDPGREATSFDALLATVPTDAVEVAANAVNPDTVVKLLFTSGSTGVPKGVITTQRTLCSVLRMTLAYDSALTEQPPILVDWLPWNHILGGTISFGCALFNGGTLYVDDGKPLPGHIEQTVRNLREIAPTFYSNVPKGYEELVPWLRRDRVLRQNFFSRLRVLQYSGASIAQHVCDAFDELALETIGRRIPWWGLLGSTEAGLITAHRHSGTASAGRVGLPPPGATLKLVPTDGKLELRVRSPSVTPGYWRRDDLTADAFDEDGFLRTGDAVQWAEAGNQQGGFRYDGRIAEDFKLVTGTWVRVGRLRAHLVQHLMPELRDVVIAGENRDYIAVLGIPSSPEIVNDHATRTRLRDKLAALALEAGGSAQRVLRFAFLTAKLSIDTGELTDKGVISQRNILRRHAALIDALYADNPADHVVCLDRALEERI